jgi:ABC-type transport system involved in multi-copper enzyme maturation permease subunit
MKATKLFLLELKKNGLRSYQIAAIISAVFSLVFLYFMAAIPKIDSGDADTELFGSYSFIINLTLVVMMGIFSILSAAVASKVLVEEYRGKRAILLFSYPVKREKIMGVKISLIFLFTVFSMLVSGICVLGIFMVTESCFPISGDRIYLGLLLKSFLSLFCYSILSGFCGIISSWIGFRKGSVLVTIIASCILMVVACQIVAMTFFSEIFMLVVFAVMGVLAVIVSKDMMEKVNKMEI